jgi:hypothetical protein
MKNNMNKETKLLKALKMKYEYEKMDAQARMEIYLTSAVGIGEHSQITEEMDKLVSQYCDAEGKLEALLKIIN